MERILVLLALLYAASSFGAQPGNAPIITIATSGSQTQSISIPLSSLSGSGVNHVFSLYCGNIGTNLTGTDFYPCYVNGAAYHVGDITGSGTPKAYCFNITSMASAVPANLQLVSATASFIAGASSLTGGVYQGGATTFYPMTVGTSSTNVPSSFPGTYVFSNATYVGFQPQQSVGFAVRMECYEQ